MLHGLGLALCRRRDDSKSDDGDPRAAEVLLQVMRLRGVLACYSVAARCNPFPVVAAVPRSRARSECCPRIRKLVAPVSLPPVLGLSRGVAHGIAN